MFTIKITDEEIIDASKTSVSAFEAARKLGINYKTYKRHAVRLGVFTTNQALKGVSKPHDRKYSMNDKAFDILTHESAYWIGFLAADGYIVRNTIKFMLNSKDEDILGKFLVFIGANYNIGHCKSHYKDINGKIHYFEASYIKITSNYMVDTLNTYGIVQGKKYKDIDFLEYITNDYKLDFLVGFFDGDGSVSVNKQQTKITISCNKALSKSIQQLLTNLDISYTISDRPYIDVFFIATKGSRIFKEVYLGCNARYKTLDRKYNKMLEIV